MAGPGKFVVVLVLSTLLGTKLFAGTESVLKELTEYSRKGDTAGVLYSTGKINERISDFSNPEVGPVLQECAKRAEAEKSPLLQSFLTLNAKWYQANNEITKAVECYSKVFSYLKSINRAHEGIWILIDIGNVFYSVENFGDAIFFYNQAESLCDSKNDQYALSVIKLNLGLIAIEKKQYPEAIIYLKKCVQLRDGKENAFKSHTYIKLSEVYSMMNKMDSVLYYIKSAEEIYYAEGTNVGLLQDMPANIGMAYFKYYSETGNRHHALTHLTKARSFMRSKNMNGKLLYSFIVEADYNSKFGNYETVVDSLNTVIATLENSRYFDFYKQALYLLAQANHETENYTQSRFYYEKYIAAEEKAHVKRVIQNTALNGILDNKPAKATDSAATAMIKKDNKGTSTMSVALSVLLFISVIAIIAMRRKNVINQRRISELKRSLDRQHEEFIEKLKTRR